MLKLVKEKGDSWGSARLGGAQGPRPGSTSLGDSASQLWGQGQGAGGLPSSVSLSVNWGECWHSPESF